ncbi:lysosome membrane protein 2-like [Epargyreus clarus]|uniref:lysosome membrane protein 2-like n=1 Tax=Epargyreus clarus TaxID=520877 RepID=UPI003C2E396A
MDHLNLDKTTSSSLMLPKEEKERVVILRPNSNNLGRLLIREDTVLANIQGCACGRAQFTCAGVKKQWSVLCWGKQSDKKYYSLLVTLSTTFALSLIGTIFFCFTNTINNAILSNMVIRNNSLAYSMWKRPPVHPLMKVHVFNYTNWERVRDGLDARLNVQDVGPFVYSQHLERVNVKFTGDQVTYQERNNFKYIPEMSAGAHFDKVRVPNLPLLGIASKALALPYLVQMTLQSSLSTFTNHHDAFIELPVHRFLWGYDDDIIDLAKPFLSLQGKLNFEKFGLLVTKNGTVSDVLTINTGENNMNKMNIIQKFNGHEHLSFWGNPECNSIESTDGSIFPPALLDKNTTLYVLYANLCRRVPFMYNKEVEEDGIKLLRYQMPKDVFDSPKYNTANQCYCEIDSATCPPSGIVNVTACAMGAPALASFPHFYRADPMLRVNITGMDPKPTLHESYIDVHPTLGLALSGRSSLQINIQVKKPNSFRSLDFLDQGLILPIAWIEMSVEHIPESLRSLVYHGTYSTAAAQLGLVVMCIFTLIVSGFCLFFMLVRRRRKPCATLKVIPVNNDTKQVSR